MKDVPLLALIELPAQPSQLGFQISRPRFGRPCLLPRPLDLRPRLLGLLLVLPIRGIKQRR
jgi:hypothetical protein